MFFISWLQVQYPSSTLWMGFSISHWKMQILTWKMYLDGRTCVPPLVYNFDVSFAAARPISANAVPTIREPGFWNDNKPEGPSSLSYKGRHAHNFNSTNHTLLLFIINELRPENMPAFLDRSHIWYYFNLQLWQRRLWFLEPIHCFRGWSHFSNMIVRNIILKLCHNL